MGYVEWMKFLKENGIDIAETSLFSLDEKDKLFELETPFIAKIDTTEPIHKTELKAVKYIKSKDDIIEFLSIVDDLSKKFHVNGIVVQEPLEGIEVFIGGKRDPQFGPVILFGLGGIFVEIVKDYSIRLCPVSRRDAEDMIREIKGYSVLAGARGTEPVNMKKLVNALVNASKIMVNYPEINEMDINPLFANSRYVKAADVRVIR